MKGKTICFDFDGVLHSYDRGWTGLVPEDPPVEGAVEAVRAVKDMGYDVVVHSTRAADAEGIGVTRKWLQQHGFPEMRVSPTKPGADLYIDDRGLRFTGDWGVVLQFLERRENLTPWRKKKWQTLSQEDRTNLVASAFDAPYFDLDAGFDMYDLADAWEMVKYIPTECRDTFHSLVRKETIGWPLYMRSPAAAADLMFECALKAMGAVE